MSQKCHKLTITWQVTWHTKWRPDLTVECPPWGNFAFGLVRPGSPYSFRVHQGGDRLYQRRFIYRAEKAPRCMYQLRAPLRFPRVSMCSWSVIDILSYKNAFPWPTLNRVTQTHYLGLRIYAESSECMITIIICYKLWYIAIAQLMRRDVVVKNKETATILWQVWTTTTWPKVNISRHESTKLRSWINHHDVRSQVIITSPLSVTLTGIADHHVPCYHFREPQGLYLLNVGWRPKAWKLLGAVSSRIRGRREIFHDICPWSAFGTWVGMEHW